MAVGQNLRRGTTLEIACGRQQVSAVRKVLRRGEPPKLAASQSGTRREIL